MVEGVEEFEIRLKIDAEGIRIELYISKLTKRSNPKINKHSPFR